MIPTNEGLYSVTSDGHSVGPYLGYQIKSMILNGGIRADAIIKDQQDNQTTTVGLFMKHFASEDAVTAVTIGNFPEKSKVNVVGVKLSFGDILDLVIKWFFATLVASLLLGIIALVLFAVFALAFPDMIK